MINSVDWQPVGVESLEPAADDVVRSTCSTLVVAGPGAGKTELLAQRACYLFQTGKCPSPKRILSISFKRDAAKNLGQRVAFRCPDSAHDFDSFTLDAFAKGTVDRFSAGLVDDWKPSSGYEVMLHNPRAKDLRPWLLNAGVTARRLQSLNDQDLELKFDHISHGIELPYDGAEVKAGQRRLGLRWWKEQLEKPAGTPSLTFPMINRLAAYLLRTNPKIKKALQETYAFVFLDEFQDTTAAQYALIQECFEGADSVLTAVGDGKQRIMLWAGARRDVFEIYSTDFEATRYDLVRNYRSAPALIEMQNIIAESLEAGAVQVTSGRDDLSGGTCEVLEFRTPETEAAYLADYIGFQIVSEGKSPRDFVIIVRQKANEMIVLLQAALDVKGIRLRDETLLQDLLVEPVAAFIVLVLRLGTRNRDVAAWADLVDQLELLMGSAAEREIEKVAQQLKQYVLNEVEKGQSLWHLLEGIVDVVGKAPFINTYSQYFSGDFLDFTITGLANALEGAATPGKSPRDQVNELCGEDIIPAMTVHRSKGLEFDTVIFLGLEDSSWWSFSDQPEEEKKSFFVAFSRAIERVYFTFSDVRDTRWGRRRQRQSQIGDLYTVLDRAGVAKRDLR
ncbi:ATP-dependent helicase [Thalassobacterium sedimentorum]|uniref:ATP-dependent helicase n=1 Tax=Thalassobacterium sedimentorum TaxID=3041258 RepID=UPI002812467C|nr:ATP-dependent helicase [Coraliomargarita sp. SDUM461004]